MSSCNVLSHYFSVPLQNEERRTENRGTTTVAKKGGENVKTFSFSSNHIHCNVVSLHSGKKYCEMSQASFAHFSKNTYRHTCARGEYDQDSRVPPL